MGIAVAIFGDLPRLESLNDESKIKWNREMEWLVSPCDYIVELVPSCQSLQDGTTVEVSTCDKISGFQIRIVPQNALAIDQNTSMHTGQTFLLKGILVNIQQFGGLFSPSNYHKLIVLSIPNLGIFMINLGFVIYTCSIIFAGDGKQTSV